MPQGRPSQRARELSKGLGLAQVPQARPSQRARELSEGLGFFKEAGRRDDLVTW